MAALFTMAKRCQQTTGPLMDEWVNLMGSSHSTEYHSASKRKGIFTTGTTHMNLEVIVLREISQVPKDKYCRFWLYEDRRVAEITETRRRMAGARSSEGQAECGVSV